MCDARVKQICPGALFCGLDDICVHLHQFCDGVTDCKLSGDDESMCVKRTCADGCTCIGETMICTGRNKTNVVSMHKHFHGLYVKTHIDILNHLNNFPDLYYLSLSDMKLSYIRPYFASLASLRVLLLSNITLPIMHSQFFHGLNTLSILHTENNSIEVIHKLAFSALGNIKYLNLSRQNITTIYECAFCRLESLEVLDLSFNKLITLVRGSLDALNDVQINLTGNPLHKINRHAMSPNVMSIFDRQKYCCFVQINTACFSKINTGELVCLPLPKSNTLIVLLLMLTLCLFTTNGLVCLMYVKKKDHKFYLIQNLAISDGCISIYFLGIASLLFTTDQESVFALEEWMASSTCSILSGILALCLINSKTTCCFVAINYLLITKFALKKYSCGMFKQLFVLLTVWLACAGGAFTYSMYIEFQSVFCVPFNAKQTLSCVPIIFNALFIIYLTTCDGLMMYLYVLVYKCLQTSAINCGRPSTSCVKVRNRGVASCSIYLSSTIGTLLLSSQQVLNYQFGIKFELYIILIIALAPLANPFIYTLTNKLMKHKI